LLKYKGSGGKNSLPTATTTTGHMNIIDECPGEGYKLCKKKLHWYCVKNKQCPECARLQYERTREERRLYKIWWRSQNPGLVIKQNKENYEKNKEKIKEKKKEERKKNPEKYRQIIKKSRQKHKQKISEKARTWRKNNAHKVRAITSKRRARKKLATPSWASDSKIKEIYKKAVDLTKQTGIEHEVDHIYPLTNKFLCGLHVETNLQIITRKENAAKGNRMWPGQLGCQKGSVYSIFSKELTDLLNE
jgi:hypothetical protein